MSNATYGATNAVYGATNLTFGEVIEFVGDVTITFESTGDRHHVVPGVPRRLLVASPGAARHRFDVLPDRHTFTSEGD